MNNTIRLFIKGKSENRINPLLYNNIVDLWLMGCIYQGIMMFNDELELTGRLSENLTSNNDYTLYTLTLKDQLKWNDGHPITTKDISYTIELLLNEAAPSHLSKYFLNIISAEEFREKKSNKIKGINILNDQIIQFSLKNPDPFFNQRLLLPIIPEHIFKNIIPEDFYSNTYSNNYIGSGPFKLLSKEIDKFIFEKNERFHLGDPYIDHMTIQVGEQNILNNLLKNKSIDFAEISFNDIELAAKHKDNYDIYGLDKPTISFIALNHNNKILAKKAVRKALAHALDREKMIKEIYKGYAKPINQYYPNVLERYQGINLCDYSFNIEKSKNLLDRELADPLYIKLGVNINNKEHISMASFIKSDLMKIGIYVSIIEYENHSLWKEHFKDNLLDMFLIDYQMLLCPNPQNFFGPNSVLMQLLGWNDTENNILIDQCTKTNEKELDVFQKWSTFINEEVPVLFLISPLEIQLISKNITNLKPSARGLLWNIHELQIKEN